MTTGAPVNKYDFGYLRHCEKPMLFLHGTQDECGGEAKLDRSAEEPNRRWQILQVRNRPIHFPIAVRRDADTDFRRRLPLLQAA
jgi:alpha/beta superfamily hydrolase